MKDFENIDSGVLKELEFSNKEYKDWLENLDSEVKGSGDKIESKKGVATFLKLITVVSGIVIASGFLNNFEVLIQIIGAVVLLIKAIEQVFANLDQLLSLVAAKDAFNRVRREVVKIHTLRLGPILGLKQSKPNEAAKELIALQAELIEKLIDIDDQIKTNLENKNYERLGRLTLDDKE